MRKTIIKESKKDRKSDLVEALLINEKLKRKAPEKWNSVKVIKLWRYRS